MLWNERIDTRVKESIIHQTYYSWWYLVFFTAPVMGSVLDLDVNSYG